MSRRISGMLAAQDADTVSPTPRRAVTVELTEVQYAMLVALARHLNRTEADVVTDAVRDLFVNVPRPGDPR